MVEKEPEIKVRSDAGSVPVDARSPANTGFPWSVGGTLGAYVLLAVVCTYPLFLQLGTHVPGDGTDDPALTWNLWWSRFSILDLHVSPLYTDYVFYPIGINLTSFTATFLNGLLSIPLQLVFGVIIANNLVVYFSMVAGGYGTFLLAREVLSRHNQDSRLAAALAGAFYAFGAWHLSYLAAGQFNLFSNEWIPYFVLYMIRLHEPGWRNGFLAGLFFVLTAWTELTFISFLAILSALYLIYLALVERRSLNRQFATNLAVLVSVAGVGVSPIALSLLRDIWHFGYYLSPGTEYAHFFAAEPFSFLVPSDRHPWLGQWAPSFAPANRRYVFTGSAAVVLAAIGFRAQGRRGQARLWLALVVVFGLLVLGPVLIIGGQLTEIPLPFAALRMIPFVNANRYPVRFNVMLMLSLSMLVALGAASLLSRPRGRIALGVLSTLLAFEQLAMPIPLSDLRAPQVYQTIRTEPGDFAILNLPLGWRNSVAGQGRLDYKSQFFQTVHQKRLLSGQTSRNPSFKFQYFLELPVINSLIALENGEPVDEARRAQDRAASTDVLRFFSIRYVEVNRAFADERVLQYALDVFPMLEVYRDDERLVYGVSSASPPLASVSLEDETARLYFDDTWGRVQQAPDGGGYRWATSGEARLWLPLAPAERKVIFRLRAPAEGQKATVRVNGQTAAELILSRDWRDYPVAVPPAPAGGGLTEFVFLTAVTPLRVDAQDDHTIGGTGVVSPVDISATGSGFHAGGFGQVFVAGRNVVSGERGYHLVAIDPSSGAVDAVGWFDTFASPGESARLAAFVEGLPAGEIVAGVAVDDVSVNRQPAALDALRLLGVAGDVQFRDGHAFVGVKGAGVGQALEQVDARWPANVAVGKNVAAAQTSLAIGGIRIE